MSRIEFHLTCLLSIDWVTWHLAKVQVLSSIWITPCGISFPFLFFITNPDSSSSSEDIHTSCWLSVVTFVLNHGKRWVPTQRQLDILEKYLWKLSSAFPFFHAHVDLWHSPPLHKLIVNFSFMWNSVWCIQGTFYLTYLPDFACGKKVHVTMDHKTHRLGCHS